jgi:hypothetical protein
MSAGKEKDHTKEMDPIKVKDVIKERYSTIHRNKFCKTIFYISHQAKKEDPRANGGTCEQQRGRVFLNIHKRKKCVQPILLC